MTKLELPSQACGMIVPVQRLQSPGFVGHDEQVADGSADPIDAELHGHESVEAGATRLDDAEVRTSDRT
jgi:hypothetical protein